MTYITIAFISLIANFGYQWVNNHDWTTAAERTFFQVVAIGLCALFAS